MEQVFRSQEERLYSQIRRRAWDSGEVNSDSDELKEWFIIIVTAMANYFLRQLVSDLQTEAQAAGYSSFTVYC